MLELVIAVVVAVIILFALFGLVNKNQPGLDREEFRATWKSIIEKAGHEATYEIAVIHADKLLDQALRKKGFKGETMGERLVSAKNALRRRDAVWQAHKLRNRLVHENNVHLSGRQTVAALKGFESALKDLGAL